MISALEACAALAAALAVTFFAYWLVGYLGYQRTLLQAEGFGDFSSDLASLIHPLEWSRFFSGMPMNGRQWEGAAYLGLGVLLLLARGREARYAVAASAGAKAAVNRGALGFMAKLASR